MKTHDKPKFQDFHIEGVKHISPIDAFESVSRNEAIIIDVRENNEIEAEYIPFDNILYHPMSIFLDRLENISKDQNIILICPGGERSSKVANLLNINKYPSVANLDGGIDVWVSEGFPIKTNPNIIKNKCKCSGNSNCC